MRKSGVPRKNDGTASIEDRLYISRTIAIEIIYPIANPPAIINASPKDSAFFKVKKAAPKTSPLYAEKTLEGTSCIRLENRMLNPFSIKNAVNMLKGSNKSVSRKPKLNGMRINIKISHVIITLKKRIKP
jgi:hypothetical protein